MSLIFVTKPNPSSPNEVAKKLSNFLYINSIYLDSVFSIMGKRTTPIRSLEELDKRVKSHFSYIKISKDKNYKKYLELLFQFYNTGDKSLEKRRGDLLELIARKAYPLTTDKFKIIAESVVYDDKKLIDNKDIDVVFQGYFIDAIECKAVLKSYLKPVPLPKKKREKLQFMAEVKSRSESYGTECNLYLATYIKEDKLEQDILIRSGFECFNILSPIEIKQRIMFNT